MNRKYDDIRPYYDNEIPYAMQRIAKNPALSLIASYVYPNTPLENVKSKLLSFKTINDFQRGIMYDANKQIIAKTIDDFTFGGVEQLNNNQPHLFISNHRDIMLDAALLQNILVDSGHDTSQITFGANLMTHPLVIDIGKSNKMFRVERPGNNARALYRSSVHISEYIRHVITQNRESVWIAQRNGRTKDGNDKTDQGIIKMFCLSKPDNKIEALSLYNIIPISVSYEWETCDILKAIELYESRKVKYIKKPGEDLNSILTGILQHKGRVHFQLCPIITNEELMLYNGCTNNEYHKKVARLIDKRILRAYKLWPNNFIAHDILYGQHKYKDKYTSKEKEAFIKRLNILEHYEDCSDMLKEIFLGIYANPINNMQNL